MLAENGALADHDRRRRPGAGMRLRPLHRHGPVAPSRAGCPCAPSTATLRAAAAPPTPRSTWSAPRRPPRRPCTGSITDPTETRGDAGVVEMPDRFFVNDNLMVAPAAPEEARRRGDRCAAPTSSPTPRPNPSASTSEDEVAAEGGGQHHHRPHHARRGQGPPLPLQRPQNLRVLLHRLRPRLPRPLQEERAGHHRRRAQLRAGLLPRARRAGPPVPGRQGGHRQELCPHPQGKPGQRRHSAPGLCQTRPTTTALDLGDELSICRR